MAFVDTVVGGGGELVRDSIHSRNYVPGASGWSINRDGTAEFSGVTVRGDLYIGNPPSPPNAYIHGTVLSGVPTIAIYDGVHAIPARIRGYDLGGEGGLVLDTGDPAVETAALAMGGSIAELQYENFQGTGEFCLIKVGPPFNEGIKLRATGGGAQDLEFGFDMVNPTPDLTAGRMYTFGEILMNSLAPDSNYASRVVDGKVTPVQTVTAVNVATDVNIGAANAQNVYCEDGYMYRVLVSVDQRTAVAGQRLDYRLWDGVPGVGTQLGGTQRTYVENSGVNFEHKILQFVWRQAGTSTIANVNLSAARAVGAANCDVATNAGYSLVVEKCGNANKVGGL